jgi:hypothetical protein
MVEYSNIHMSNRYNRYNILLHRDISSHCHNVESIIRQIDITSNCNTAKVLLRELGQTTKFEYFHGDGQNEWKIWKRIPQRVGKKA